jgi:oligopeptide/dipeptide ABC transporter ATP-binding protein
MLMTAVPRLDKKWEDVDIELKAKQSEYTGGCVYYGRCPLAAKDESCTTERPELRELESDHFVACSKL